ncbi:MAG: hypothetical protein CMI56_00985 [Parcubacteria group bacterium]|nr:hypothetical protein [Parcubacteria group bacterium]
MKANSKPTTTDRKRKKVPLLGSFGEYTESKKKAIASAPQQPATSNQVTSSAQTSVLQFMAPGPTANGPPQKGKEGKSSVK